MPETLYDDFHIFYHTQRKIATEKRKKVMNSAYAPYIYSMKKYKRILFSAVTALCMTALCACGNKCDYTDYLSDVRSDLFCAETENFSVTLSCVSREYPYVSDGVASAKTDLVEIVLKSESGGTYEIYILDDTVWGGEMSFRNVSGDYYYSRGTERFPEGSVSLRVVRNGKEETTVTATSVKNENTLSVDGALSSAIQAEGDTVGALTKDGLFYGEIYVRLLRRDKNYYYVGIVDKTGRTVSLLLDAETGEVLARRVSG